MSCFWKGTQKLLSSILMLSHTDKEGGVFLVVLKKLFEDKSELNAV